MVPTDFRTLAIPGKTPAQAVQIYFDSQYPNTNNCNQLDAQIANITADLVLIKKKLFSDGVTYPMACKSLWESQLTLKKKQRGASTCTNIAAVVPAIAQPAPVASNVSGTTPIMVADIANPNPSVVTSEIVTSAPKNPNAPDGSGSAASNNDTATSAAAKPDYFSKKNLIIGSIVLVLLGVVGVLVSKKHKKAKD